MDPEIDEQGRQIAGDHRCSGIRRGQGAPGDPTGVAQIDVDDVLVDTIKHHDGTTASYAHDYSGNCMNSSDVPTNPLDIPALLKTGVNTVTFAFMDKCGGVEGRWETWLTLP